MREEKGFILAFYTIKANGLQTYTVENEYNAVPVVEIARLAVGFKFQHIGVGRKLFYEYILPKIREVASLIAVRWIVVFVEPDNIGGIRFYESLGFKKAEKEVQQRVCESFNECCDLYILELHDLNQ